MGYCLLSDASFLLFFLPYSLDQTQRRNHKKNYAVLSIIDPFHHEIANWAVDAFGCDRDNFTQATDILPSFLKLVF